MEIFCMIQWTQTGALNNPEEWERVGGGRESQEGVDICTPMINSCWCITEIKPIL